MFKIEVRDVEKIRPELKNMEKVSGPPKLAGAPNLRWGALNNAYYHTSFEALLNSELLN